MLGSLTFALLTTYQQLVRSSWQSDWGQIVRAEIEVSTVPGPYKNLWRMTSFVPMDIRYFTPGGSSRMDGFCQQVTTAR
jgi:hypothetical protein